MIVSVKQLQFKENMTFVAPYDFLSQQVGVVGVWGDVCGESTITDENNIEHNVTNGVFYQYGQIGNIPNEYLDFQTIEVEVEEPPVEPPIE